MINSHTVHTKETYTPKLHNHDDTIKFRTELIAQISCYNQKEMAEWGILLSARMVPLLEQSGVDVTIVHAGIKVLNRWRHDEATVYEIREASFNIHALARSCPDKATKAAARTIGHVVAIGHMKEHALVASDYAIQAISFASGQDINKISAERKWHIAQLRQIRTG